MRLRPGRIRHFINMCNKGFIPKTGPARLDSPVARISAA
jgi:hypothetical protein